MVALNNQSTEVKNIMCENGKDKRDPGAGMAYIASDRDTGRCYAACSAELAHAGDAAEEVAGWIREGALVSYVSMDVARHIMTEAPAARSTEQQLSFLEA